MHYFSKKVPCLFDFYENICYNIFIVIERGIIIERKIDLCNYHVVRSLILNRIDIQVHAYSQQDSSFLNHTAIEFDYDTKKIVEDVYLKLDKLIVDCKFSEENIKILEFFFLGFTFQDISSIMNVGDQSIFNRLRRMILKINNKARECQEYENNIVEW